MERGQRNVEGLRMSDEIKFQCEDCKEDFEPTLESVVSFYLSKDIESRSMEAIPVCSIFLCSACKKNREES